MKNLIFLLVFAIATQSMLFSQCLPEGITFNTQEEIDNFQTNYPGCTVIEGDLKIQGDDISNLNGLSVISAIGGHLSVSENDILSSLTGLENLVSIEDDIHIKGNSVLTSLAALESLESVGSGLTIWFNPVLNDLSGLVNLIVVDGPILIQANQGLTSLTGFDNISVIQGYLIIENNGALTDISALENLTSVGGSFEFGGNSSMQDLSGLENLEYVGGSVEIWGNSSLSSFAGLSGLTSINEMLRIGKVMDGGNNSLTNLAGLESIVSIEGELRITGNANLTSLTGLDNLTSISGNLQIGWLYGGNPMLTNIESIRNIDAASIDDLYILYNSSLSVCAIESICDYLVSPNGYVDIHDNAPGCNSPDEIEEVCYDGIDDGPAQCQLVISPNPITTSTTIHLTLPDAVYVKIEIHDITGRKIKELYSGVLQAGEQQFTWDAEGCNGGVYFLKMEQDGVSQVKKLLLIE